MERWILEPERKFGIYVLWYRLPIQSSTNCMLVFLYIFPTYIAMHFLSETLDESEIWQRKKGLLCKQVELNKVFISTNELVLVAFTYILHFSHFWRHAKNDDIILEISFNISFIISKLSASCICSTTTQDHTKYSLIPTLIARFSPCWVDYYLS